MLVHLFSPWNSHWICFRPMQRTVNSFKKRQEGIFITNLNSVDTLYVTHFHYKKHMFLCVFFSFQISRHRRRQRNRRMDSQILTWPLSEHTQGLNITQGARSPCCDSTKCTCLSGRATISPNQWIVLIGPPRNIAANMKNMAWNFTKWGREDLSC